MNWDQVEGKWKQLKGSVQSQWGKLTDDEIDQTAGDRKKLEGKIQEKYGLAKEEAEKKVDEWMSGS
ncbi:MAG: CsbD family protein [Neomegalonema sp.]|nr:CsbD family protein [Neomegalonema sp.]